MRDKRLSKLEIEEICKLYKDGSKSSELGILFKVSPEAINYQLRKNNIGIIKHPIKRKRFQVDPGDNFGRLTVIEELDGENGYRFILCECSCPDKTVKKINLGSLMNGDIKSCGCYHKESVMERNFKRRENGIGKVYGRLTIIYETDLDANNRRRVFAKCSCDGNIKEYNWESLKRGATKSCGCYNQEQRLKRFTLQVKDYEERHPLFCQVEEIRDSPNGLGIEVRCKHSNCNKWFKPTRNQLKHRLLSIESPVKFEEINFYCSDECKYSCDTYRAQITPKSLRNVKTQSRCNQKINKKALLDNQLDECGHNYCEKCGKPFAQRALIIHHNIMVSKDHTEADNMSHQIIVCRECHTHKDC